eukprot:Awhi_evm1s3544
MNSFQLQQEILMLTFGPEFVGVNQSFPQIEIGVTTSGLVTVPILIDDICNGKKYNSQMFAGSFASNLE